MELELVGKWQQAEVRSPLEGELSVIDEPMHPAPQAGNAFYPKTFLRHLLPTHPAVLESRSIEP